MMCMQDVAIATQSALVGMNNAVLGVATDTRKDCRDQLFIALKGENFDAHDFLPQLVDKGAAGILCERAPTFDLPYVVVEDTAKALLSLATWWRDQFAIPVIAITGSAGKTSVKEMLRCILSAIGDGVVTEGNLNNSIGMPMTLLELRENHRYAVIEIGINQSGEMEPLAATASPTVALVNNAAAAHLSGLGSVSNVAEEKGRLYRQLRADGIAVINADDAYAAVWRRQAETFETLDFSLDADADIVAKFKQEQDRLIIDIHYQQKRFSCKVAAHGRHSAANAVAAVTCALAINIPTEAIQNGLKKFHGVKSRLQRISVGELTLIDDSYNANPSSMRAAIEVLAQDAESTLIVGDMAELGEAAEAEHVAIGRYANDFAIKRVFACGDYANLTVSEFEGESYAFAKQADLVTALKALNQSYGTILIKGSRSAAMENVVEALLQLNSIARPGENYVS